MGDTCGLCERWSVINESDPFIGTCSIKPIPHQLMFSQEACQSFEKRVLKVCGTCRSYAHLGQFCQLASMTNTILKTPGSEGCARWKKTTLRWIHPSFYEVEQKKIKTKGGGELTIFDPETGDVSEQFFQELDRQQEVENLRKEVRKIRFKTGKGST